jgi:hypothetical protein
MRQDQRLETPAARPIGNLAHDSSLLADPDFHSPTTEAATDLFHGIFFATGGMRGGRRR